MGALRADGGSHADGPRAGSLTPPAAFTHARRRERVSDHEPRATRPSGAVKRSSERCAGVAAVDHAKTFYYVAGGLSLLVTLALSLANIVPYGIFGAIGLLIGLLIMGFAAIYVVTHASEDEESADDAPVVSEEFTLAPDDEWTTIVSLDRGERATGTIVAHGGEISYWIRAVETDELREEDSQIDHTSFDFDAEDDSDWEIGITNDGEDDVTVAVEIHVDEA